VAEVDYAALAAKHGGAPDYAAVAAEHGSVHEANSQPSRAGTTATMIAGTVANAAPVIRAGFEHSATNPNLPKIGSAIGQAVGGIQGAMRSPLDAAGGAWAGGKAGWFTGKLVQKISAPLAAALEKAAPVLKQLGPLLGAFGAEGAANQELNSPESLVTFAKGLAPDQQLKMATLLVDTKQLSPAEAIQVASGGDPKRFGPLMTAYMKSRSAR